MKKIGRRTISKPTKLSKRPSANRLNKHTSRKQISNKNHLKNLTVTRGRKRQIRNKPAVKREILIRRSSGRKEKFDANRLAQTVSRSGVPYIMARDIAKKATKKIKSEVRLKQGKKKSQISRSRSGTRIRPVIITANRVRNLVTQELGERNRPDIAKSYAGSPLEHFDLNKPSLDQKEPVLDTVAANRTKILHDRSKR